MNSIEEKVDQQVEWVSKRVVLDALQKEYVKFALMQFTQVNESDCVYEIQELWTDPYENRHHNAMGYESKGYVTSLEEAKRIVENGKVIPKDTCWALSEDMPQYKFVKLEGFKNE